MKGVVHTVWRDEGEIRSAMRRVIVLLAALAEESWEL